MLPPIYARIVSFVITCLVVVTVWIDGLPTSVAQDSATYTRKRYEQLYPDCRDLRSDCASRHGQCTSSDPAVRQWMHPHCPVTCQVCHNRTVTVSRTKSIARHLSKATAHAFSDGIGRVLGVPQILAGTTKQKQAMVAKVEESIKYMSNVVLRRERYLTVRHLCQNQHAYCAQYAVLEDRCNKEAYSDDEDNEYYYDDMIEECAVTCQKCELLSQEAQCPYNPDVMKNAWYPGDVNAMFERIVRDYSTVYNVTVLSRPAAANDESARKDGPWVLTLDNFLSPEECQRLIDLGYDAGYERSYGMAIHDGALVSDLVSDQRTSRNTWCDTRACQRDPLALAVRHRMANLTQISPMHSEPMQLLKYDPGEFYKTHHDYVPTERNEYQGPRILTIFLYLSRVEEGGGTNFPALNLTVEPLLGRALIWPSVHNHKPNDLDLRVLHQALPVIRGVKYGANIWLHQRDMQPASCRAEAGLKKTNDY